MRIGALCGAWMLAAAGALAQGFPAKPVRIVSPYPPGGGNDTLARTIAPRLGELLGQQVIVDNRPGANTIIGTEHAARSAPDGHTMVLVPNVLAINPYLYAKLPYDAARDFTPITLVGTSPLLVAVHPSVPVRDMRGLIALARSRPGQVQYGSSGDIALILVSRLQKPVAKAVDYALAAKHDKTIALHVAVAGDDAEALQQEWQDQRMPVPLVILAKPWARLVKGTA